MSERAQKREQSRARVALGAQLARSGFLGTASIVIAIVTTVLAIVIAGTLARRGDAAGASDVTAICASALAWGAGIMLAFAAASRSLVRDREDGVRALIAIRGGSSGTHANARVLGLALVLAVVLGGGTIICGAACTAFSSSFDAAARAVHVTLASLVYVSAFASVLAPLSLAALGARSRAGGYVWMVLLLFVPEMITPLFAPMVPAEWREAMSVPAALGALRGALMPDAFDVARFARAAIVLALVASGCVFWGRRELERLERELA